MNKKLLLIALPVFMALSGCSAPANKPAEKVENEPDNILVEDNLAHEEVFGGVADVNPVVKKAPLDPSNANYKIGYQLHYDSSEDELSVRFIAAINADYAQMRWSRGLAKGNGTETKRFSDHRHDDVEDKDVYFDSTEVYTSLSNGGEDAITAGVAPYAGYTKFIVYSLTNIPYEDYKDSYLAVSLTLHPAAGADVVTPVYAIKIETNAGHTETVNPFSFSSGINSYFLYGSIASINSGTPGVVLADTSIQGDNNLASFTGESGEEHPGIDLATTDNFGYFYFNGSSFKYFCRSTFFDKSIGFFKESSSMGGYCNPYASGRYKLYVSDNVSWPCHVFTNAVSYVETPKIYFYPNIWAAGSERFAIYMWNSENNAWANLSKTVEINGKTVYEFDFNTTYDSFKFGRMSPSDLRNQFGNPPCYNESGNFSFEYLYTNGPYHVCKINGWDSDSEWVLKSNI